MACTVAVEEVITEHYDNQLRLLHEKYRDEAQLREVCPLALFAYCSFAGSLYHVLEAWVVFMR